MGCALLSVKTHFTPCFTGSNTEAKLSTTENLIMAVLIQIRNVGIAFYTQRILN